MYPPHEPTYQWILTHRNTKHWASTQRVGDCRPVGVDSTVLLLVLLELKLQEVD